MARYETINEQYDYRVIELAFVTKSVRAKFVKDITKAFKIMKARILADTPVRTGKLKRAFRFAVSLKGYKLHMSVINRVLYSKMVEDGTKHQAGSQMVAIPFIQFQLDVLDLIANLESKRKWLTIQL